MSKSQRWKFLMPLAMAVFFLAAMVSGAWARVTDFRVGLDSTVTDTRTGAVLTVELLNSQGQIDPAGYQEVASLEVDVASNLAVNGTGKVTVGADQNGVVVRRLSYDRAGHDTIYVTVKENYYTEPGDSVSTRWRIIGSKKLELDVTNPSNIAEQLRIDSITPPSPILSGEQECNNSTACGSCNGTNSTSIVAGRPFTVEVEAIRNKNEVVRTQNSPVELIFVWNNLVEATVNGTIENGKAFVKVPEGTLTKSGVYQIYMKAPSSGTASGYAREKTDYKFKVVPGAPTQVALWWDHPYQKSDHGDIYYAANASLSDNLTAEIEDQYGNKADNSTLSFTEPVKLRLTCGSAHKTITIHAEKKEVKATLTSNQWKFLQSSCVSMSENGTKEEETINVTGSSMQGLTLATTSLDAYIYSNAFSVNGTALSKALTNQKAGIPSEDINGTIKVYGLHGSDHNATLVEDKLVKLVFYKGEPYHYTEVESHPFLAGSTASGNVSIPADTLYLKWANGNFTAVCVEMASTTPDKEVMPACVPVDFRISPNENQPTKIAVYRKKSSDYDALTAANASEVDSFVALPVSSSKAILKIDEANGTSTNSTTLTSFSRVGRTTYRESTYNYEEYDDYAIRVLDPYGNFIIGDYGKVTTITSADGVSIPIKNPTTGNYTREYTSDEITLKTNALSRTIPVKIDWGSIPSKITISTPSDYILVGSWVPMLIQTKDDHGEVLKTSDKLIMTFDNISAIRVFDDSNVTAEEINSGDRKINTTGSGGGNHVTDGTARVYAKVYGPEGDVTITVKNLDGSLSTSKTFHIVNSVSEVPVTIGSVEVNPASVTINKLGTSTVTVTVRDTTANPVGSYKVSIKSDNPAIAAVSNATVTTDANGQAQFTITAGSTVGDAHITVSAGGQSAVVTATVSESVAGQCDADHLNLCTTQADCTAAGGNWCNGACQAEACPVCDADHLNLCTTEANCTAAGGNWCNGACQAKACSVVPVPTGQKVTELTGSDIANAPVDLGSVVTGGDQMQLAVNFPAYEAAVDEYVAIQTPDGTLFFVDKDGNLTTKIVAYAVGVTAAQKVTLYKPFDICTPFGPAVPTGKWTVYSLVSPTNGGDLNSVVTNNLPYDLPYYTFNVSCP